MENQIEEMRELIHEEIKKAVDSGIITWTEFAQYLTERLTEQRYRKQSDTAREIFAEVGKILTAKYNSIQAGYHHRMRFGNADTPQGMKELGELSGVRQAIAEIKAFEKKYLEANDAESN